MLKYFYSSIKCNKPLTWACFRELIAPVRFIQVGRSIKQFNIVCWFLYLWMQGHYEVLYPDIHMYIIVQRCVITIQPERVFVNLNVNLFNHQEPHLLTNHIVAYASR